MSDDAHILIKTHGFWDTLDGEPQGLVASANGWGPDRCAFGLVRDSRIPYRDLAAHIPLRVDIGGIRVWSGTIRETPADDDIINVEAQGLQYSLDEWPYYQLYAHNNVSGWVDWRSSPSAALGTYLGDWNLEEQNGTVVIWGPPSGVAGSRGGVFLDLGASGAAKRLIVAWARGNAWAGAADLQVIAADTLGGLNGAATATIVDLVAGGASGTYALTTGARYLLLYATTGTAQTADKYVMLSDIQVYGNTAWESGNTSNLKASTIIAHAAAATPTLLSTDTSRVAATTTSIAHLIGDYQTKREIMEAVNAVHGHALHIDLDDRIVYQPLATAPKFRLGEWSGYTFTDPSLNSGAELYGSALVLGQDRNGQRVAVERTQTVPVLTAAGRSRRKVLTANGPIDTTLANSIGDAFLALHASSPLRGTLTVQGSGDLRGLGDEEIHASLLLRNVHERVRLEDHVNPDTGALGRTGRIVRVEYAHDDRAATLDLDDTRRDHEAYLAELGVTA